jgi:hypothetical protein
MFRAVEVMVESIEDMLYPKASQDSEETLG